jgi:disulfide oxidoreductase YuzD
LRRRFGEQARIDYVNIEDAAAAREHAAIIGEVSDAGLLFPVTVIDGEPIYDGSVSYPAILRQVEARIGGAA